MASRQDDDLGPLIKHVTIAMIILPIVSVFLRIWSRSIIPSTSPRRFWWDDWVAFIGLGFSLAVTAFAWRSVLAGLGKHIEFVDMHGINVLKTYVYAGYLVWDVGICLPKLSALLFYARIFPSEYHFQRIGRWVIVALLVVWLLFRIPEDIWECDPPQKWWDSSIPGHCVNDSTNRSLYLAHGILDCIIDLSILLLPIPQVWALQMRLAKKLLVCVAFICGYACLVASIGRPVIIGQIATPLQEDYTYYSGKAFIWFMVEIAVAVFSVCIPSWFYLIKRFSKYGIGSLFKTNHPPSHASREFERGGLKKMTSQLMRIRSNPSEEREKTPQNQAESGSPQLSGRHQHQTLPLPEDGVEVRRDLSVYAAEYV